MKSSQTRDNIAVITAFVAIALVVLGLVAKCGSGSHSHSTSPSLQASHTTATKANHPPIQPTATASVSLATLHTLAKRAQPVIRLYSSFPNKQEAPALIEQLRPLVEPVVIKNLEHQWCGSTVDTVRAKVQKITSAGQYVLANDKVEVDAMVSQKFMFAQTPANTHLLGVAVTFQRRANGWVITSVADKQGDV